LDEPKQKLNRLVIIFYLKRTTTTKTCQVTLGTVCSDCSSAAAAAAVKLKFKFLFEINLN
jgi:hypothetical protein